MIEFRTLKPEELDTWFDHCSFVFGNGQPNPDLRRMLERSWSRDPRQEIETIRVAVEEDRILSTVQTQKLEIYLCGQAIPMGGIALVSTRPEARRLGLSTRLLEDAIRRMEAWDQPVSMLQTGIHPHYRKLGWEQISLFGKTIQLGPALAALPAPLPPGCTIRPLGYATDLPQVGEVHRQYSSRFNGSVVRSLAQWQNFNYPPDRWWVAEAGGQVVAYFLLDIENEEVTVAEFGALPGHEGLFDALLGASLEKNGLALESIQVAGVIEAQRPVTGWQAYTHWMARLNRPLLVGGQTINNTPELIALMSGKHEPGKPGNFNFWGNDGF